MSLTDPETREKGQKRTQANAPEASGRCSLHPRLITIQEGLGDQGPGLES